jgi:hypothetical protein
MPSKMVDQTRTIPTLIHKEKFAYESSAPPMARANGYAQY